MSVIKNLFRPYFYRLNRLFFGQRKISKYFAQHPKSEDRKIVFGGHWNNEAGWLLLREKDVDITHKIPMPDNSVGVVFTEHVIEHINPEQATHFFKEARRILIPGGVLRTVFPEFNTILSADLSLPKGPECVLTSTKAYDKVLNELNLSTPEILAHGKCFVVNDLFRNHEHKFIWQGELLARALRACGFGSTQNYAVGQGSAAEICIERKHRYPDGDKDDDNNVVDFESLAIEAYK